MPSATTLATPIRAESLRMALRPLRNGGGDPTTRLGAFDMVRATLTPDGPGTVRIEWGPAGWRATTWGPGGPWLAGRADAMLGLRDAGHVFTSGHPAVLRAQRDHPDVRIGASGTLYHELLPAIIAQRITTREAVWQWRRLVLALGEPAPGPFPDLRLPPAPERLAEMPTWWFHPLGIERTRAQALVGVARHADRLWEWSASTSADAAANLWLLRGVGEWTIGLVLGVAFGEPDALLVGDYHLKNIVVHALTGRPRGTDEEMCALLEPYRGQRGRVARLLAMGGPRPPKFGPKRRLLPMHRW